MCGRHCGKDELPGDARESVHDADLEDDRALPPDVRGPLVLPALKRLRNVGWCRRKLIVVERQSRKMGGDLVVTMVGAERRSAPHLSSTQSSAVIGSLLSLDGPFQATVRWMSGGSFPPRLQSTMQRTARSTLRQRPFNMTLPTRNR